MPPEMIPLLPVDGLQDKVRIQKRATPIPIAKSVEEALSHLDAVAPNAVSERKR